jgi:hypothetical protein
VGHIRGRRRFEPVTFALLNVVLTDYLLKKKKREVKSGKMSFII